MNLITKGVLRFAAFVVFNAIVDYMVEHPMNIPISVIVATLAATLITYLDYRKIKKQEDLENV